MNLSEKLLPAFHLAAFNCNMDFLAEIQGKTLVAFESSGWIKQGSNKRRQN